MNKEIGNFKDTNNLAAGTIAGVLSNSGEDIKEMGSKAVENVSEFLGDRKEDLQDIKSKCQSHIKNNPFTTVIGSLAVGTLIGMFLRK